jgi:hypothetical protein
MTRLHLCRAAALLAFALALLPLAPATAAPAKPSQACGGLIFVPCPAGHFCQAPAGRCFVTLLNGSCERVPQVCTRIYRPVCGCDGRTYSNDCVRRAARVSKRKDGRC